MNSNIKKPFTYFYQWIIQKLWSFEIYFNRHVYVSQQQKINKLKSFEKKVCTTIGKKTFIIWKYGLKVCIHNIWVNVIAYKRN